MGIRKLFGRKKEKEKPDEKSVEVIEEAAEDAPAEKAEVLPVEEAIEGPEEESIAAEIGATVPYHDSFPNRLLYMFSAEPGAGVEAPDEFSLEFMAMGERFYFAKAAMGEIEFKTGTITDEDVFIRIGEDVVKDLLAAATFSEFSTIYLRYYKNPEPGKFVKIELRKPVGDLNKRGYARVPLLKLLIGTAR